MLCGNGGATVCAVADSKCLHFISTVSGYFRGAKLPPSWQPRGLRAWARLAPAVPGPSVRASVKTAGHSDARPQTFRGARASGELQPSGGLVPPLGRWAEAEPSTFVHTAPVCVPQKWTVTAGGVVWVMRVRTERRHFWLSPET